MMRSLIFCVIVTAISGCCTTTTAFVVPDRPVLAEYTEEELRSLPRSVLLKMAEETAEVQAYIDKVEANEKP